MSGNRDPIYAPDGKTWYQTALDEAAKRGEFAARIEQLEAALRLFADDENWRYGRRFDPNGSRFDGTSVARAALDQSSSASCSGCAGITHTHTCGDPAKQPQLDNSPPTRQENDDVFKGFRGNNEA
jgi:hypothetical protein